jgi:hypothetical protein
MKRTFPAKNGWQDALQKEREEKAILKLSIKELQDMIAFLLALQKGKVTEIQRYDIDESKGYPSPVIVPDKLGDYYLADEVDPIIAALEAAAREKEERDQSPICVCEGLESYKEQVATLTTESARYLKALEKIANTRPLWSEEAFALRDIAKSALKQTEPFNVSEMEKARIVNVLKCEL